MSGEQTNGEQEHAGGEQTGSADVTAAVSSAADAPNLEGYRPAPKYGIYAPGYDANTSPEPVVAHSSASQQPQTGQAWQPGQNGNSGQQPPQGPRPNQWSPDWNPYARPQKNNGLAVSSLVLSLASMLTWQWLVGLPAILAIIFGHIAVHQIKKSAGQQGGKGMARAGLVIGYIVAIGSLVLIVLLVILAIFLINDPNGVLTWLQHAGASQDFLNQLRQQVQNVENGTS